MTIPEKYAKYFTRLDIPSVITDENLKIVWKNEAVKNYYHIRTSSSIRYYISKYQFSHLKRLKPGETIAMNFVLDEPTPGFGKRKDDCYIFRISRFNGAAQQRITELFDARYFGARSSVASFTPQGEEPFPQISAKRLDRLTGLFEGLCTDKLLCRDLTVPLIQFANQATCALSGIKVNYVCDRKYMSATYNLADLLMALSAMTACAITYAPFENNLWLELALVKTDVVISIKCRNTGFASTLADVYKDHQKLDALCEYGAHYLNLLLINVLCEHYDWQFDITENGEFTSFSITMTALWDGHSQITLYSEEIQDDIIELLLSPFRKEKKS